MPDIPYLPLYFNDFDRSTRDWDDEEVGAYVRLLMHQWAQNGLPTDKKRLKKISNSCVKHWSLIGEKFIEKDGKFFNEKLEEIRADKMRFIESQRNKGKKGGRPKKPVGFNGLNPNHKPNETQSESPEKVFQSQSQYTISNEIVCSETSVSPTHTQEEVERFGHFQKFLSEKAPNVQKLKYPFTIDEYLKLFADYPGPENRKNVLQVLEDMHNRKDLLKKYNSANLTCRSWIRIRAEKTVSPKPSFQATNVPQATFNPSLKPI